MEKENYIKILESTLMDPQYMTLGRATRFVNKYLSCKKNERLETIKKCLKEDTDYTIKQLEQYEYEKNYRYFTLHEIVNIEEAKNILKENSDLFNSEDEFDIVSTNICKPTIKFYGDDEIDLKFSFLLDKNYKYVVIASIYLDINMIAIKYCSVANEYLSENLYINKKNEVKKYIKDKLNIELDDFDSIPIFKKLYTEIEEKTGDENLSLYNARMNDDRNGSTYFKANNQDLLPFLQTLKSISDQFESEKDKYILAKYINDYIENSIIQKMGIKWKNKFKNNKRHSLGSIIIGVQNKHIEGSDDNKKLFDCVEHYIIQDESVNKERIDYVIRYIKKYINKDTKRS